MYQRDYILRLIEQAAEMIRKVVFLRRNRQFEEAMAVLNQAMKSLLGVGSELVRGLSVKDLLKLLSKTGEVDIGKSLVLGDMLKAEAMLLEDLGDTRGARQCRLKAIELLLTARNPVALESEWRDAFIELIDDMLPKVERVEKSVDLLMLLFPYYDETGRFAKAEDSLFHYIEALVGKSEQADAFERGIRMVEGWADLSEDELIAGGLSLEEVTATLAELKELKLKHSTSSVNERE